MLFAERVLIAYTRHVVAAFLSAKWFKAQKDKLKALLKRSVKYDPEKWTWSIGDAMEFFRQFENEFHESVTQPEARKSISSRVESMIEYIRAVDSKLPPTQNIDFENPVDYLKWSALSAIYRKMGKSVKTIGDLFKVSWFIDMDAIDRLIQKTLRLGTPAEVASLTKDDAGKFAFISRTKFQESAAKLAKKTTLDLDISKWVDRMEEMLAANYSEQALQDSNALREFDLNGLKVIVDDKTVNGDDVAKYIGYLKEAYALLRSKGFAKAWYGNIFIQCIDCGGVNPNTGGGVGGHYFIGKDTVNIYVRPSSFVVELVVHELGHRYWFKHLNSEQRGRFESLIKVHTVPRPPSDVRPKELENKLSLATKRIEEIDKSFERLLKAISDEGVNPKRQGRAQVDGLEWLADLSGVWLSFKFDPTLESDLKREVDQTRTKCIQQFDNLPRVTTADELKTWVDKTTMLTQQVIAEALIYLHAAFLERKKQLKEEVSPEMKAWLDSYQNNDKPVLPVSDYGASNIDEAWAEVFAHYVLGVDMTRDQIESFKSVLSSRSLVSLVAETFLALPVGPAEVKESY